MCVQTLLQLKRKNNRCSRNDCRTWNLSTHMCISVIRASHTRRISHRFPGCRKGWLHNCCMHGKHKAYSGHVDTLRTTSHVESRKKSACNQAAAISHSLKGQDEVDMDSFKEAGACGFTDDGIPLTNACLLLQSHANAASWICR